MSSNFQPVDALCCNVPADPALLFLNEYRPSAILDAIRPSGAGDESVEDLSEKRSWVFHDLALEAAVFIGGPIGGLPVLCVEAMDYVDVPNACTLHVRRSPARPKLGSTGPAIPTDHANRLSASWRRHGKPLPLLGREDAQPGMCDAETSSQASAHCANTHTATIRGHRHSSNGTLTSHACCTARWQLNRKQKGHRRPFRSCNDRNRIAAQQGTGDQLRRILWKYPLPSDNYTVSPRIEE